MGFLIETGLWIEIERGRLSAADIHAITRQAPIYLSPVNLAEIRYGIDLMTDARQKQRAGAMLRRMRRKPLLTANPKDFKDVPGLKFVSVNAPSA